MNEPLIRAASNADFARVFEIQEQHKKYFFIPRTRLEQAIKDGQLLVAESDGVVNGYVWTRKRHGKIRIKYLAVESGMGKQGIGSKLVTFVKSNNAAAYSIHLSCRKDYPAWSFWKKMGFSIARDRAGLAKSGSTLSDFYFELKPLPLFSGLSEIDLVAIDANVFFDIIDDARPHHGESSGLLADWITAVFDLGVTPAIHDDISRTGRQSPEELRYWLTVETDASRHVDLIKELEGLIGPCETPQDKADRSHLAHAIGGNAVAFITRDEALLDSAEKIVQEFGVECVRPSEFIVNADAIADQGKYDKRVFTSVDLATTPITTVEDLPLGQLRRDEKERQLRAKLRGAISNPKTTSVKTIGRRDSTEPAAIQVTELKPDELATEVSYWRAAKNLSGTKFGQTLMMHLSQFSSDTLDVPHVIRISDADGVAENLDALLGSSFEIHDGQAFRFRLPGIWKTDDAIFEIEGIGHKAKVPSEVVAAVVSKLRRANDVASYLAAESCIWPGKLISNGLVEGLVVPIRPRWARSLFDHQLGQRELWDSDTNLLLSPKNVYYSAARPRLDAGRILWYVSDSKNFIETKCLRACSQLTKRVQGRPLDLYRTFRHFGVYEYSDVDGLGSDVIALEFKDTELFSNPVSLGEIRDILNNQNHTFQGPTPLSENQFLELYSKGIGT